MGTYRRTNRRYRRKRRVAWYNKRYSAKGLALKALKNIHYIKGLVNAERHYVVSTVTNDNITSAGTLTHLSNIAQGDTQGTRTGNSILARSLFGRIGLEMNPTATVSRIRILIVCDNQQIADTSPSATDVLLTASTLSSLDTATYPNRFKVLKDMLITLDDAKMMGSSFKINIPMYKHIKYNGANSTDIAKNGIYILYISSESVNYPTISYNLKLGYYDN